MDGRFFGACFSFLGHKNGAIAPVDYSSTFATAPFIILIIFRLYLEICLFMFTHRTYHRRFLTNHQVSAV